MTRFVAFVFIGLVGAAGPARSDCAGDSPMHFSERFGVATCRAHEPRYDSPASTAAVRFASAEDPMVWSDDQWRTSLFNYNEATNGAYDRRARGPAPQRVEVEVERRVIDDERHAPVASAKPRGPKIIDAGSRRQINARPGVLRFEGHNCRGVLVLTVGEAGTTARCKEGRRFQMLRGG